MGVYRVDTTEQAVDYSILSKMFVLNLGQRLIALHYAQASLHLHLHRLLPRTPVKPPYLSRGSSTAATYLPHPASNLQLRSSSKHPWEIPKGYGKRKPALSNAESSNENINKKYMDEADLASRGLNHLLQTRKDDSVVWGEDFIGYQIEHQRSTFGFEDMGGKNRLPKVRFEGPELCYPRASLTLGSLTTIPRQDDIGY